MNKIIKNIIFDLDGVLVDACDWHYESLNRALIKNGFEEINISDHKKTFNGLPTKVKLKMLNLNEEQIEMVSKDKQDITLGVIHEMCLRDKSKIDFMSYLKNHGVKIGCVTNSIKKTTIAMLSNSGIIDFIDKIITNEDVVVPKPDPEGYIKCMESFFASPQDTIIVEDSEKGVMAASKTNSYIWVVKNAKSVTIEDFNMFCSFNSLGVVEK